jgi:putative SOS response-associated peptidase YedK
MLITEPNKFVAETHDRMPVILEHKDFEQWERGDVKDASALMKPAAEPASISTTPRGRSAAQAASICSSAISGLVLKRTGGQVFGD